MRAVLACKLEGEIPAERVAGDADRRQAVDRAQLVDHVRGVSRETGMKQAGRKMFRIAAVPLVQPQDVHASRERLRGEALHVVRVARPVQAVQREQRRMLPGPRLPVAVCNDPRVERHGEITRVSPAVERHPVAVPERRAWLEPIHRSIIPDGHAALPRGTGYDRYSVLGTRYSRLVLAGTASRAAPEYRVPSPEYRARVPSPSTEPRVPS